VSIQVRLRNRWREHIGLAKSGRIWTLFLVQVCHHLNYLTNEINIIFCNFELSIYFRKKEQSE